MTSAMELDGKGLEAAARAVSGAPFPSKRSMHNAEAGVRAYLTTSGLTDRLKELERERDDWRSLYNKASVDCDAKEFAKDQAKAERDALAADIAVKDVALAGIEKAVLRGLTETEGKRHRIKLHPDWTVDGQYLLGTTADNIRDSLRGIANIARAALSKQPPASLKVEKEAEQFLSNLLARIHRDGGHYEAAHGTAKATADADDIIARLYAEEPHPAEGQGERGEADMRLNGRDLWECANQLEGYVDERTPENLARFLMREGKAASDLADEVYRLRNATPPAPRPLERAVKIGDIIHQIALWSDDEGLELSMGQGEDLARRIRSALPAAPVQGDGR